MPCCIQFASYTGKEQCKDGSDQEHANTPRKCTQPPKHLVCKCILSKTKMDVMDQITTTAEFERVENRDLNPCTL